MRLVSSLSAGGRFAMGLSHPISISLTLAPAFLRAGEFFLNFIKINARCLRIFYKIYKFLKFINGFKIFIIFNKAILSNLKFSFIKNNKNFKTVYKF